MTPDLLQALLNNTHLLVMLPCFIWLFYRLERMEERMESRIDATNARLDTTIADTNARSDASNARLDATWAELTARGHAMDARLDATWQKLVEVMERTKLK